MHKWKVDELANVLNAGGKETVVRIEGDRGNGQQFFVVDKADPDQQQFTVDASQLLPLKKHGIHVRGFVMTTSKEHRGEIGEIVGTGTGVANRKFFEVKFPNDLQSQWFSEDDVFVDDKSLSKPAAGKATFL